MKKQTIRLNEAQLNKIIKESVKNILNERKPSDKTIGKHSFKGLRYDKNGNPLYTSDTLSDEQKKEQGWKYSKKHGLHGQISDPTKINESKLVELIKESVIKVLKEDNSYTGNDLDYQTINDNAYAVFPKMEKEGLDINWRNVAEYLGYRIETLNEEDLELLKDAIEDAMYDEYFTKPYWQSDTQIGYHDQINENKLTKLIKESVKNVLKEYKNKDTERFNTTGKKRGPEERHKMFKRVDDFSNSYDGSERYLYHNDTAARGLARIGHEMGPHGEIQYGDFEDDQWLHDHPVDPRGNLYKNDTFRTFDGKLICGGDND